MNSSSGVLVAKYEHIETVHAEQWDGSEESTKNLMAQLEYAGLNPTHHPSAPIPGLQQQVKEQIWFDGGMLFIDTYLVKSADGVYYVRGPKAFEAKFKKVG